jgi:O-antigen/teichoic acid export membrane protein
MVRLDAGWLRGLFTAGVRRIVRSELVRVASVYTVAQVLNALIPLLLLPILTRHMDTAEYGVATLFATLVALTNIVVGLSLHGAIQRAYFDDAVDHPAYVGTCLYLLGGATVAVGGGGGPRRR